jgi:hypothetical protein
MKNLWKWLLGIALVLVLFFGPYLFHLFVPTFGYGYGGMMGGGRYGGMMGYGFFPFGGLMWLVPLGTLVLVVLGIVWLVNNLSGGPKNVPAQPQPQARVCASCGAAAQADWKTCPYCGTALE